MSPSRLAPAKVNLFLHVGPLQADGYHPVASLMAFADIGDRISIQGAEALEFEVDGPYAEGLEGDDNLVVRARTALLARARGPVPPFRLLLTKALPVAAGLGGGSSDAGAALKLMRDALGMRATDADLAAMAAELGADGPACLQARPVVGTGRGDVLSEAPRLPSIDAVLVNPNRPCATGAVYRAFDALPPGPGADLPPLPDAFEDAADLAAVLSFTRNDLEPAALSVTPEIGAVLETLRAAPETLLARMSGSGATCFALCASDYDAEALAAEISALSPGWWVRRCRLGGPWPEEG